MNSLPMRLIQLLNAAWRQRYAIVLPALIFPFVGILIRSIDASD